MKAPQKVYLVATVLLVASGLLGRWDPSQTHLFVWTIHPRPRLPPQRRLSPWKPGFLDIHHLHVGSSVSSFLVTPDGTTILIDAGEIDLPQQRQWWRELGPPYDRLQAVDPFPNASQSPSEWIVEYLQHFWPHPKNTTTNTLDYVLLTHFHGDHFGDDTVRMKRANVGNYSLSGIYNIANHFPVRTWIDRGYPDYHFPRDLSQVGDPNIDNYLRFVNATSSSAIQFQQFQVGSTTQIQQIHRPNPMEFRIQVVKNNDIVLLPNGTTTTIPGTILDEQGHWNENTMSAAIVIQYGNFRYYEGGDQEVVRNPQGDIVFDTIGPTALVVGQVDVASLNHHGHGVTKDFVDHMDPNVMILQGWCSDQPATRSMELLNDRIGQNTRQFFATFVFPERLEELGTSKSKLFASAEGHVVVRVHPPLDRSFSSQSHQNYEIFVLDGSRRVKSYHGTYSVRESGGIT